MIQMLIEVAKRPRRGVLCSAAAVLCVAVLSSSAHAVPILTEVRVRAEEDGWAKAHADVLQQALVQAVQIVLSRHVPAEELKARARQVKAEFLGHAAENVLRYALRSERRFGSDLWVSVDVEVDRKAVLEHLRRRGFTVLTLPAVPRVLVVPLGADGGAPAGRALRDLLEREGIRTRTLPADSLPGGDPAAVAVWARNLGCHVALVVSTEPAPAPEAAASGDGRAGEVESTPGLEYAVAAVEARGWAVDARQGKILGEEQVTAEGMGPTGLEAGAAASARAGRQLAYPLWAHVEQSGWAPGVDPELLQVQVEGLGGPALVEGVESELSALAEARSVSLWELGHRSAVWRVEAVDSGLAWDTLLASVRLPRGRLLWSGAKPAGPQGALETVEAQWVER